MIRINLLPQQKRSKSSGGGNKDAIFFILFVIITMGIVFGVDMYVDSEMTRMSLDLSTKNAVAKQLESQVQKVNSVLAESEKIEGRIRIIKDIRLRQGLPVKYIDEIVINIPRNKMWMTTFSVSGAGQITLSGVALDNQTFAAYVEQLRTSKYIGRVDTQKTSRTAVDNLGLIAFSCSVTAKEYFENFDVNGTSHG